MRGSQRRKEVMNGDLCSVVLRRCSCTCFRDECIHETKTSAQDTRTPDAVGKCLLTRGVVAIAANSPALFI